MGITTTTFATFDEAVETDTLIRDTERILTDARIAEDLPLPSFYLDAEDASSPVEYVRQAWTTRIPHRDHHTRDHRIDFGWTIDELDEIVELCHNAIELLRHLPDGSGDADADQVRAHILPRWESLRTQLGDTTRRTVPPRLPFVGASPDDVSRIVYPLPTREG